MTENALQQTKSESFALTPKSLDEAMQFADILAKSSVVPKDFQGNPGNVLVAVQWGAEIGLPPLQAMQSIAVINGRPAIWGDAMIALVRGSGALESITEECDGQTATCTVTRRGEQPVTREYTMEDAKVAGLAGKQGPWKQYPKRMLQMRARSFALRDVFPDVLRGVHIAEEARDMHTERDMGEAEIVQDTKPATRNASVRAALADRRKSTPDVPPITIDHVLQQIAAAADLDALTAASADAAQLTSDADKKRARTAWQTRKRDLESQPPAFTYAQIMDQINGAQTRDDIDTALSLSGHLPDDQRRELSAAAEQALDVISG